MNRCRAALLAAGLASMAGCGGAQNYAGSVPTTSPAQAVNAATSSTAAPASTTTATTAPATTATTAPYVVTFKASGSGGQAKTVTILDGGSEQQHQDVALPYSLTVPDNTEVYGLTVQTADGTAAATVTCEIDEPGHQPQMNTSTGPYALATCTGL